MTDARRREIRRIAYAQAAQALDAAVNVWEVPARLFADAEERAEFERDVNEIRRRLAAHARRT